MTWGATNEPTESNRIGRAETAVPVPPWGHRRGYRRRVATIEPRGASWRVYWRMGGRGGPKQSTTWRTERRALQAKQIAEAHKHQISDDDVYAAVTGKKVTRQAAVAVALLPTVAEWADTWLASRTRIGPAQRRIYRRQLDKQILPAIGHLRLDEVTGVDVSNLLQELGRTRKPNTVDRYYACLHAMFGFAVTEGKIDSNPARRTDWVRDLIAHDDIGDEHHVYLTRAEYRMIVEAADPRARPLIEMLADSGGRFSEITALDVGDLRLTSKPAISVVKAWKTEEDGSWYRGATKGRNRRTVELPPSRLEALKTLVEGRTAGALLFTAPQGGRVIHANWVPRFWNPAIVRASRCAEHPPAGGGRQVNEGEAVGPRCGDNGGVGRTGKPCRTPVHPGWDRCKAHRESPGDAVSTCDCPGRLRKQPSPHDLRHSHVAWLIATGRPIVAISRQLGHRSTAITERTYAGILPSVSEGNAAALDELDGL